MARNMAGGFSRRQFMQFSAASAVSLAVGAQARGAAAALAVMRQDAGGDFDVIVVGAGVAGLGAGQKLQLARVAGRRARSARPHRRSLLLRQHLSGSLRFRRSVLPAGRAQCLRRHEQPALRSLHRAGRPGRAVRARARLLRERRAAARCRASAVSRHDGRRRRRVGGRRHGGPAWRTRHRRWPTPPPTLPVSRGTRSRPRSWGSPSMCPRRSCRCWMPGTISSSPSTPTARPRTKSIPPGWATSSPNSRTAWTSGSRRASPRST